MQASLFPLLLFILIAAGNAFASEKEYQVGLSGSPWKVFFKLPDFKVEFDGVKPDGRRYFFCFRPSVWNGRIRHP